MEARRCWCARRSPFLLLVEGTFVIIPPPVTPISMYGLIISNFHIQTERINVQREIESAPLALRSSHHDGPNTLI